VVEPEAVPRGDLGRRDLEVALTADDHDLVADASVGNSGQIDPCVLERWRSDDGGGAASHEDVW